MSDYLQDITPEGSEVPAYLDPTPAPPITDRPDQTPDELIAAQSADRDAGIAALMNLGLPEDQARAIAGI